jgi:hypothetical protein
MPPLRAQVLEIPAGRPFKLHLMLHGDVLEAFVDDRISLFARVQIPKVQSGPPGPRGLRPVGSSAHRPAAGG